MEQEINQKWEQDKIYRRGLKKKQSQIKEEIKNHIKEVFIPKGP